MTVVRFVRTSVIVALLGTATSLGGQTRSEPAITVRVYDVVGFAGDDLTAAQRVAEGILQSAGVRTWWRECWREAGAFQGDTHACGTPLQRTEVIVRIVMDRFAVDGRNMSLGYSVVVAAGEAARLATVFGDRVTRLADRVRFDRNQLLGRAIAHEVGHLLLGSNQHSQKGLMRAHWSDSSLSQHADAWQFSLREAQQIRAQVMRRDPTTEQLMTASTSSPSLETFRAAD